MTKPARHPLSLPIEIGSIATGASDRSEQLANALDQFAVLRGRGECLRPQDFIAKFPELADELEEYLPLIEWLTEEVQPVTSKSDSSVSASAQAGISIGGYRIVRQVGKGGMGTVYEAWDVALHRRVALKVLANHLMLDPNAIARFHYEARAVAQLDHPHIVPVLDNGSDGDSHYYSMRFIQGYTLAQIFRRMRWDNAVAQRTPSTLVELSKIAEAIRPNDDPSAVALPLEASTSSASRTGDTLPQLSSDYFWLVAKLGEQAADALHYAHQQGVIHRDIKPSNLMLDLRGHLWITDFGLAKIESNASLTMTGELIGTLRYMSPEQAHLSPAIVDQRTDVYSLGATLYEMATLQAPIASGPREEVVAALLHGMTIRPRRLQANLPKELETILLKALEKNSADRYPSARALADDLRRFSERRPIMARRAGWGLRLVRWSQRNPKLTAVSIALFVFLLLTLVVSGWWVDANYRKAVFESALRQQQEKAALQAQRHLLAQDAASLTIQAATVWRNCDYAMLHELMETSQSTPEDSSLPRRILHQLDESRPAVLALHQGPVYSVCLSPDQSLVASSGEDGVRIHHRETGELLQHLRHHEGDVNGIAWSKDGRLFASAGDDGQAVLYSTGDWQVIGKRQVPGALVSVQFSLPLGLIVACERDSRGREDRFLHVWELEDETGHQALSGLTSLAEGLSLSSDGKLAAVACRDGMVYVWDLQRRELLHRLLVNALDADQAQVSAVAFANHSAMLAACARDGSIRVFDALTGQSLPFPPSTLEFAESIAFSSDDNLLAVGIRQGLTQVFQRRSSGRWISLSEFKHEQGLWSLCFANDKLLYAAGQQGRIEFWDCALPIDRRVIKILPAELSSTINIDESPKIRPSNWNASRAYERAVAFYQPKSGTMAPYDTRAKVEMLSDAKKLAISSSTNRSFQILDSVTGMPILERFQAVNMAAKPWISDDETQLLLRSNPNEFALVEAQSREILQAGKQPFSGSIAGASFSSDRSRLYVALGTVPGQPLSGQSLVTYNTANLEQVPISSDCQMLNVKSQPTYTSRALRFLMERSDTPLARAVMNEINTGQVSWVGCSDAEDIFVCALSRSGLRIFRASEWEHPTRVPLFECPRTFAVSPDGSLIASCEIEHFSKMAPSMLRLFDTVTGREVLSLRHYMLAPWYVCFSTDGRQLMLLGNGISDVVELAIWGD